MAAKQITRNVALTPHLDRLVQRNVNSGRYQSASEVVREGLRLLEQREREQRATVDRLKADIEEGWQESERGEVVPVADVVAEISAMSKARRAKLKRR